MQILMQKVFVNRIGLEVYNAASFILLHVTQLQLTAFRYLHINIMSNVKSSVIDDATGKKPVCSNAECVELNNRELLRFTVEASSLSLCISLYKTL